MSESDEERPSGASPERREQASSSETARLDFWNDAVRPLALGFFALLFLGLGVGLMLKGGALFELLADPLRIDAEMRGLWVRGYSVAGSLLILLGIAMLVGWLPTLFVIFAFMMWLESAWPLAGVAIPWFFLVWTEIKNEPQRETPLDSPAAIGGCFFATLLLIGYGILVSQSAWPLLGLLSAFTGVAAAAVIFSRKPSGTVARERQAASEPLGPEPRRASSPRRGCPQCGSPLPDDAPDGLCPRCLLQMGFESGVENPSGAGAATIGYQPRALPPSVEQLAAKFPQLEILERIGQGGMGVVYKARQKDLDRIVALKVLRPDIEHDPAFAERFVREARALARLSHPAIVTVHDFGRSDGFYYLMMEYVAGANLRELERSGNLQPTEALAIVPQICEALQYAHDQGVVHRDIKPENILIDAEGRVKIADFGLAKMVGAVPDAESLTGAWQVMGTPNYMAPEQMRGLHDVDHRADIYSLGVVIYEMLTGELPSGRFPLPSQKVQVDVRLDQVVLRAMEREPTRRYQKASEVQTDVETICGLSREAAQRIYGREYRSQTTLLGLPLIHIALGLDPRTGRPRTAKGILAIGDRAVGVVAIGGAAAGGVAIGGAAVGLLSIGGLAIGMVAALGGVALGGVAAGGLAVGVISLGGTAVGLYAYGGGAWGLHALGSNVQDPVAIRFFDPWGAELMRRMWWGALFIPACLAGLFIAIRLGFFMQDRAAQRGAEPPLDPHERPSGGRPFAVTVPDSVVARRWLVFSLLAYVSWTILLLIGHVGYTRGAPWYFQEELPYQYLIAAMRMCGALLMLSLGWWWYLHAKRPSVPRSLADFWETLQRPDGRALRLFLCVAVFLTLWFFGVVSAMLVGSDDLQALILLVPFLLGPVLFIIAVYWAYASGLAGAGSRSGIRWRELAQRYPGPARLFLLAAYLSAFFMFFGSSGSGGPEFSRLEYSIGAPFRWYEFEMETGAGGHMRILLFTPAWLIAAGAFAALELARRLRPRDVPVSVWEFPHSHAVLWFVAALGGVLAGYVVSAFTAQPEPHRGFGYTLIGFWLAALVGSLLWLYWTNPAGGKGEPFPPPREEMSGT